MANKSFTLRIEGLDDLITDFKRAGVNYGPIIAQAMNKSTQKLRNTIKQNIVGKGITFQGNLGRSVTVIESNERKGVVGVGERYGGAVEFGRKAGKMPPVAPIERWAALKLGAPGAGFVIARKIGRKGTKAQPFVKPAFVSDSPVILKYFGDARDVVVQMMGGRT